MAHSCILNTLQGGRSPTAYGPGPLEHRHRRPLPLTSEVCRGVLSIRQQGQQRQPVMAAEEACNGGSSSMPSRPAVADYPELHLYDTVLVVHKAAASGQDVLMPTTPVEKKRKRVEGDMEIRASAFLLARYSNYFSRALRVEWGGESKRLEVTVDNVEAFGHLLEFIHSVGKALPEGVQPLQCLMSEAHVFGVEACLLAVAKKLQEQAANLWISQANAVLVLTAGKECEGQEAAAAMSSLHTAAVQRLQQLLGRLDDMINQPALLEAFCSLDCCVLEALFMHDSLNVDYEETAFCAFAHWMAAQTGLTHEDEKAVAARILPHIRFASMQPAIIATYWHTYRWFREFDASKGVLVEAIVHAATPFLAQPSRQFEGVRPPVHLVRRALKQHKQLEFVSEVAITPEPGSSKVACGTKQYWGGLWWQANLDLTAAEQGLPKSDIGIFMQYSLPPGANCASAGLIGDAAVGPVVDLTLSVATSPGPSSGEHGWHTLELFPCTAPLRLPKRTSNHVFSGWGFPNFSLGSLKMPDGSPIHRSNFRAAGSPILHDGKLLVKVIVSFK